MKNKPVITPALIIILQTFLFLPCAAQEPHAAEQPSELCGAPPPVEEPTASTIPEGETILHADETRLEENIFTLKGNVQIEALGKQLRADKIEYDHTSGEAEVSGNVTYRQQGLRLEADKGIARFQQNRSEFDHIGYELTQFGGRGEADHIQIDPGVVNLSKVTYTTCPKERQDWRLVAKKITLDQEKKIGTATNVRVLFRNVPLYYFPRFTFPISDQRKSGFLSPTFGNSSRSGAEVYIPYYWNIAPSRDATFTLHAMSDRGLQLNSELRTLQSNGYGTLKFDYLPDDRIYKDYRSFLSYRHRTDLNRFWRMDVAVDDVSDNQYFEDFGQTDNLTSITHLERRLDFRYDREYWFAQARFHDFQSIGVAKAYRRLPQLVLDAEAPTFQGQLNYFLQAEWVRFDHPDDVVTGQRLDLQPGVTVEWRRPAYYVNPRLSERYTRYQLDSFPGLVDNSPARTTPIFSLDSGLYLERPVSWHNKPHLLTLEPRLYYLYIPYRDQSDIPLFDTDTLDFSFAQLFRNNRFSGPDRQGDANQLTLAISSRLIQDGQTKETLQLNLGQIIYLDDRRVGLTGTQAETRNSSDFVGEISGQWNAKIGFRVSGLWDPERNRANKAVLEMRYHRDPRRLVNLAYRYDRGNVKQTDLSTRWELSPRWNAVARWTYSMYDERTIEALGGVEYDACCWSLRMVARRYLVTNSPDLENAIYLQLTLKGLTSLGTKIDDLLERSILGYQARSTVQ